MANQTPRQRAALATEKLKELDAWVASQDATIRRSQSLTPSARRQEIDALRRDYRDRWMAQAQEAKAWLAEEDEGYFARANPAEKAASKDEAIIRELTRQRIRGRAEQLKDTPGRLIAMYETATRNGDKVVAEELEAVIPPLLPQGERQSFEERAEANAYERLPENVKAARAEYKEFQRERSSVQTGLAHMESARAAGYVPGEPSPNTLVTSYPPGRPPQTDEIPNPRWRNPAFESPTNEPVGGTIAPDPSEAGAA